MKKVIKGKLYDTETAKAIGSIQNAYPGDFHYFRETLYRKRTGEFFLYGVGGAASKYAERVAMNEWEGGEKITPLEYEQAREWAEEHLDADEYAAAFGMPDEGGETRPVGFLFSEASLARLRQASERTGKTQSEILEELIKTL